MIKITSLISCFIGIILVAYSSVGSDETGVDQKAYGYFAVFISVIFWAIFMTCYKRFSVIYIVKNNNNNNNNNDVTSDSSDTFSYYSTSSDENFNNKNININDIKNNNKIINIDINNNIDENENENEENNNKNNNKMEEKEIEEERLSTAFLSTSIMGIFILTTLWPGALILNYFQLEIFEMPTWDIIGDLTIAQGLGAIQVASSLAGINFTSPLFMGVGSLLLIPTSMITDWLFHDYILPIEAFVGIFFIIFGFLIFCLNDYLLSKKFNFRKLPPAVRCCFASFGF